MFDPLLAISPVDGRYATKTDPLRKYLSEYALIKTRVCIEIKWLIALSREKNITEIQPLSQEWEDFLENLVQTFTLEDAQHIKAIEKTTNHDVKAVEYFIKEKMATHPELKPYQEFVHFACTSEDINNLSYACMLQQATEKVILPALNEILSLLIHMAHQYAGQAMLSRTHGQAATPTTLGKELANVAARLKKCLKAFQHIEYSGKINGAVGNFNAHVVAYPAVDWLTFSQQFVEALELSWNPYTTQIEPHDDIASLCHLFIQTHTILLDFCRNMWGYVSLDYFKQKLKPGEIGSSTMPHKVNPIDFENSEGNLGIANALFSHFAQKLPISRWQRDLSDSTVLRSLGSAFGHALIAYGALKTGLQKLEVNIAAINADLQQHPEVLAEAIQTVMRRYGMDEPYEQLKALTRGQTLHLQDLQSFIDTLTLPNDAKARLQALLPQDYIGLAKLLADKI